MNFILQNNNSETLIAKVMNHFGYKHQYQVAEYFGVTAQTLSGWVKSGTVPDKYIMKFKLDVQEIQKENNVKEPVDYTNKREFQNSKSETASSEFSFTIFFANHIRPLIIIPFIFSLLSLFTVLLDQFLHQQLRFSQLVIVEIHSQKWQEWLHN